VNRSSGDNEWSPHALSPTARRLLLAARRILERSGIDALTLDAVGRESGERKSLIHYHFGGKPGLLDALLDWWLYVEHRRAAARFSALLTGDERVEALVEEGSYQIQKTDRVSAYLGLFTHATSDDRLRAKLADLYSSYRQTIKSTLTADEECKASPEMDAFASLLLALWDGLAIQRILEADAIDVERILRLANEALPCVRRHHPLDDQPPAPDARPDAETTDAS
jgi:AcrR family transcriptional regulator